MFENFQRIDSLENSRIKFLVKLNTSKHRREAKQFMVENFKIILDALKAGYDLEALFVTREFTEKHVEDLQSLLKRSRCKDYYLIDSKLNKRYSGLDTPSGITAVYTIKDRESDGSPVIYLNGVSDPGNLGTIMRSALAFGFINLVLDEGCADVYNNKVVNAAKDAIFKLNIITDKTGGWLRNNNLPVYAADSHDGIGLAEFTPANNYCLVLGSESRGIDPGILKLAEKRIKIEISSKIESLNVASAAAILFYEFKRRKIDQA